MIKRGLLITSITIAAIAVGLATLWLRDAGDRPDRVSRVAEHSATAPPPGTRPGHSNSPASVAQTPPPVGSRSQAPPMTSEGVLRLEGRVVNIDRKSVSGAVVTLGASPALTSTSEEVKTTSTDEEGSFAFDGLLPGNYSLKASKGDLVVGPLSHSLTNRSAPVVIHVSMGSKVEVKVVDALQGNPVPAAVVTVSPGAGGGNHGQQATTDNEGVATLRAVAGGHTWVEARADGYAPARTFVDIPTSATASFKLEIRSGVGVSGYVWDDGGAPVIGARVVAEPTSQWMTPVDPLTSGAVSDDTGKFSLAAVAPGSYRLLAVHRRYQATKSSPFEVADGPVTDMDVVMKAGAGVSGRVVNANQQPVGGATVRATPENLRDTLSGHRFVAATSAPDGSFELTGLGGDRILVFAVTDAASSKPETVDLRGQPTEAITLVLDIVDAISGKVVDGDGRKVPNARVTASRDISKGGGSGFGNIGLSQARSATTGADGAFAVKGLAPGAYVLTATRTGIPGMPYQPRDAGSKAHTGDTGVTLVLKKDGNIEGRVVFSSGETPTVFKVAVGFAAERKVHSDNGAFEIDAVTPGTHNIMITGPRFSAQGVRGVVVHPEQTTDIGTITVEEGRSVSGRVLDPSGNVVAGATVVCGPQIIGDGNNLVFSGLKELPGVDLRTTKSDGQGEYVIAGLPMTRQMIASEHPEVGRSDIIPIPEADSSAQIDINLYGFGSLAGMVTQSGKPVRGAQVVATGSGGVSASVLSGDDGLYLFERLPSDNFEVKATLAGQSRGPTASGDVEIEPQTRAKLDLEMQAGDLTLDINIAAQDGGIINLAKVFVFEGMVEANTIKEIDALTASQADTGTVHSVMAMGTGAPLKATLKGLNPGPHTACITPITGDLSDEAVQQRLKDNRDEMRVYCESTTLAETPVIQAMAMIVPAMAP